MQLVERDGRPAEIDTGEKVTNLDWKREEEEEKEEGKKKEHRKTRLKKYIGQRTMEKLIGRLQSGCFNRPLSLALEAAAIMIHIHCAPWLRMPPQGE